MKKSNSYLYIVQGLFLLPIFYYWLDQRSWSLANIDLLAIFPLLGLIAFVMMWFHLMVAYLKRTKPEMFDYKSFYRITGNIVLALIILHPLIVIIKAYDFGIFTLDFKGESGRLFVLFGVIALTFFLIYEVVERLREKPFIKKNWELVVAMNRVGFTLVYIHALYLGQHLQTGWMQGLWVFFGATTLAYFAWSYYQELTKPKEVEAD